MRIQISLECRQRLYRGSLQFNIEVFLKIEIKFVFQVNLLSKYTIVDRRAHKEGDSNLNHWKICIRGRVLYTAGKPDNLMQKRVKIVWIQFLLRKSSFFLTEGRQSFVLSDFSVWGGRKSSDHHVLNDFYIQKRQHPTSRSVSHSNQNLIKI